MAEITTPMQLSTAFASALKATKADFASATEEGRTSLAQHGAVGLDPAGFPGWPADLAHNEAVIETYVASADTVTALSDNEPFVTAWSPLAQWMNTTVRRQLGDYGVALAGDTYITASLTSTLDLEGLAHMDDDTFSPSESVGVVAIIGQLAGPRIATGTLDHEALREMTQVTFSDAVLAAFAADELDHCAAGPDELVVFPQFAQLHAGPAAADVARLAKSRQLLVLRGRVEQPA